MVIRFLFFVPSRPLWDVAAFCVYGKKVNLLTENQYKMRKGEKLGYKTYVLHLLPNTLSGYNVCPQASPACISTCLNLSSHGRAAKAQAARKRRTLLYFNDREQFNSLLEADINEAARLARKENKTLCIRLNGTSDLPQMMKVGLIPIRQ